MISLADDVRKFLEVLVLNKGVCDKSFEDCKNCFFENFNAPYHCKELAKMILNLFDNQQKIFENDFGYYVFNPSADKPTYRHASLKSAKAEAERLIATGIKADEIEILKIVDIAKVKQVLDWNPEENSELPF